MKTLRTLLTAFFFSVCSIVSAQEGMFGYIDFNNTLKHMPDYVDAEQKLKKIQSDYKEEIERSKREFGRQYINFILEQDHLSPTIVAKRQKENQLMGAIEDKVLKAIKAVGEEGGYVCIFNIAGGVVPYVSSTLTTDVTEAVKAKLGIK